MQADHRHLCNFENPTCTNYILLQRAFLTTITELEAKGKVFRSFLTLCHCDRPLTGYYQVRLVGATCTRSR